MSRMKVGIVDIEGKRAELAAIPKGCISHKRINGKVYCYRQWTEGGKTRSEYLSQEEAERFKKLIVRRRARPSAFKLLFASGEFDMVVTNPQQGTCDICEIKHTAEPSDEQFRHLTDSKKCAAAEKTFGRISSRIVYYRGPDFNHESGVLYRNVEKYLSGLGG